jgi:hypothetical protein
MIRKKGNKDYPLEGALKLIEEGLTQAEMGVPRYLLHPHSTRMGLSIDYQGSI